MNESILKHSKTIIQNGVIKKEHNGYLFIKVGMAWMPEHSLVCEEKIGRLLNKGEVIHHIDGNKKNNIVENLMIFKTKKEHLAFHNKIRREGLTENILRQIEKRWKEFGK